MPSVTPTWVDTEPASRWPDAGNPSGRSGLLPSNRETPRVEST